MMPTRSPTTTRGSRDPGSRVSTSIGPSTSERAVQRQPDAERLRELAGARAEVLVACHAAATAHELDAVHGLERPDQHGRPDPLLLGHRVQQRVDPVGEVDVRPAGLAEQRLRALGDARVGVAGGLLHVVALGLDDAAGGLPVPHHAAHEVARHVMHRAAVEARLPASRAGLTQHLTRLCELVTYARHRGSAVGHLRLEPRALVEQLVEAGRRAEGPARPARPR